MKIVIIGGHLGPALSVIEALPKDTQVLFIGRKYALEGDKALSLEYKTIISRKIEFIPITTGRFQRRFTKHTVFSILKFPLGLIQSFFILKKYSPDVVMGFGGYVSLPVCLSAFFLNIPVVIHEQTLEAGCANKIISIIAKKVCVSWENSKKFFPKSKTILTGNPVRQFQISRQRRGSLRAANFNPSASSGLTLSKVERVKFQIDKKSPVIYVTGGSLGSHAVNLIIEKNITKLLEKFVIIHQTGDAQEFLDFDRLNKMRTNLKKDLQGRYILTKFVDPKDTGYILQNADLVVGRSGINTVTEFILFKKPALLIPLSFSQRGEQIKNALFLKDKGAAEIYYQDEKKDFFELLTNMFNNIDEYKNNVKKLEKLVDKNAASKIVNVIKTCLKKQERISRLG